MIRLQEHFPETYKDILSDIPRYTARVMRAKQILLEHCSQEHTDEILRSMHDYAQISEDVLRSLDISRFLAEHPNEIDDHYDRYGTVDLDQLCVDLKNALSQDKEIQRRISGVMLNYCCFELQEEYEDCVIHNLPQ